MIEGSSKSIHVTGPRCHCVVPYVVICCFPGPLLCGLHNGLFVSVLLLLQLVEQILNDHGQFLEGGSLIWFLKQSKDQL